MARFVLVHGGFSGAWIWLPLMNSLKTAGHLVEAFDLPGMAADSEPAVVVGHSMGGIVATQGAARCPERIAALVYVAAFLPKDGQSLLDLTKLPEGDGEQVLANVVVEGEPPVAVMSAAASRHALYGSCTEDVAAWAIARQCPQPISPLPMAVSIPPEPSTASTGITCCVRGIGLSRRHCSGGWSPRTCAPTSLSLTQITRPSCR